MRFIIVGASIAGMAASVALGATGHRITIYERSRGQLQDRGAGLVVDDGLIAEVSGQPASVLGTTDILGRRVTTVSESGEVSRRDLIAPFRSTTWQRLHRHLLANQSATVRAGVTVEDVTEHSDRIEVRLSDGTQDSADGVVLADGYDSRLRSLVDPDADRPQYEGYGLLRAAVPEAECSPDLHGELFNDMMHLCNRSDGYGLVYTTPGPGGATTVGERTANAGLYFPMSEDEREFAFRSADGAPRKTVPAGTWEPNAVRSLVSMLDRAWDPVWRYPLLWGFENQALMGSVIYTYRPSRIARGRIAVVGDSAHATSPITGSGSAAALKDALALADAVRSADTDDTPAIFDLYDRTRITAVQTLVDTGRAWGVDFLTTGVVPEDPPIVLANVHAAR